MYSFPRIPSNRFSARSNAIASVVILALVLTILNAIKPLTLDDNAYLAYARQIAEHPSDPYGFSYRGGAYEVGAFAVLIPPLLPYYLAPAIRIFGPRLFLIKLALLPFALVLVLAMRSLLGRYTRGLVDPLLWATALGPAILPLFNLMLDVPATALSLGSLAWFVRASSRNSLGLAALAGVTAGLAAETKYTGLLLPAIFLAHAATHRGWGRWVIATVAMVGVFGGCEALIALRYGESHFLHHAFNVAATRKAPGPLAIALVVTAGGFASAVSLVALVGLRSPYRSVAAVGWSIAAGYALLGFVPGRIHPGVVAWAFFVALGLFFFNDRNEG